jgi:hypothetical protein
MIHCDHDYHHNIDDYDTFAYVVPNPNNLQSPQNQGLYKILYRYVGEITNKCREFCKKMIAADKLYRKEDIVAMENKAVNPGWGPHGAATYDIWFYKGGGNCHHLWRKETYINAKGINPLANDAQRIAVAKAAKMGYKVQNNELVALLPVDMDYNGFLEDNPVYGKDGINYRR